VIKIHKLAAFNTEIVVMRPSVCNAKRRKTINSETEMCFVLCDGSFV